MSFKDVKKAFEEDTFRKNMLAGGNEEEGNFRYWLLRLLFEINGNLDSLAADYKAMRQAMEKRNGGK